MRCFVIFAFVFVVGLGLTGCVSQEVTPGVSDDAPAELGAGLSAAPTTEPAIVQTEAPRQSPHILIQFESIDCSCHLGEVDKHLLKLPGVVQVVWDTDEKTADLVLDGSGVPTNKQIVDAAQMPGVTVFNIKRP